MSEDMTTGVEIDQNVFSQKSAKKLADAVRILSDMEIVVMYNQAMAFRQQQVNELGNLGQVAQREAAMEMVEERKVELAEQERKENEESETDESESSDDS